MMFHERHIEQKMGIIPDIPLNQGGQATCTITSDATLTAQWTINNYELTIGFNRSGSLTYNGTEYQYKESVYSFQVPYGSTQSFIPQPNEKYITDTVNIFTTGHPSETHPCTISDGVYSFAMPAAPVSLRIQYSPLRDLVYYQNYGAVSTVRQEYVAGTAFTLNANPFTRTGYVLNAASPAVNMKGWTYGDTAEKPSLADGSNPGHGGVVFEYRKKGAADTTYSETVPTVPGEYTVRASIAETAEYQGGTAEADFTIAKKNLTISGVQAAERNYEPGNKAVTLSGGTLSGICSGDAVTIDYSEASAEMADADAGRNKQVTVTGVRLAGNSAGYYQLSGQPTGVTVNINKADAVVTVWPEAKAEFYIGEAQELVTAGTASGGKMVYSPDGKSFGETIPTGTAAGEYDVYFKVIGDANYNDTAVYSVKITIEKTVQDVPAAPEKEAADTESVTLKAVEGCEYKCDDGEWQSSNVFTGLEKGTEYTFCMRRAEDENHLPSMEGEKTVIRTELPAVSVAVTFRVVNGAWDNGKKDDAVVTLEGHEGDTLALGAEQIPAVGNKADEGYKAGNWDTVPVAGAAIAKDTTYTYIYSEEYIGRKMSSADTVEILYRVMLGRASDAKGKADWLGRIENGGTLTSVINGFSQSEEFTKLCRKYGITAGSLKETELSTLYKAAAKVTKSAPESREKVEEAAPEAESESGEIKKTGETEKAEEAKAKEEETKAADEAKAGEEADAADEAKVGEEANAADEARVEEEAGAVPELIGTAVKAEAKSPAMNAEKAAEFVGRCYKTALGRDASEGEINGWAAQIMEGKKSPDQIIRGFLFSEEFRGKKMENGEIVKILYKIYMNREADPEGLAYWTGKLDEGESLENVVKGFAGSEEFKRILTDLMRPAAVS